MHTGLYFGSFNPVHIGHLMLAQYMYNTGKFDRIRFVVSPQNPFKPAGGLLDESLRLACVKAATADNSAFEVSDVEFSLPRPSYTIQTLRHLVNLEPDTRFSLIIGSDNLSQLGQWKEIESIAGMAEFHVYTRRGSEQQLGTIPGVFHFYDAPFLDISATYIRALMAEKKNLKYMIPDEVIVLLREAGVIG